ncbi:MAG: hypothetical protein COZ79_04050 [Hydrogenophilales bacterium CG_4_8_14_3_um_filter_62_83]|nr:hypothetical protein [Betaproteobacteria bacterium]PIX01978.1 MAG: hypothetical protein COZ79_04050 [Hydrogenophilales bacterium CG_4_8_14_3_um_filter_62_83]
MNFYRMIGAISIVALFYAPIGFAAKDGINSATVSYTKTAGGYTYIKANAAGKEEWLAVLPMEVLVGDKIEYSGGDVMKDFKSKAMNQTFANIRFVSRIHVVRKDMPKDDVHKRVNVGKVADVSAPKPGEIAKAEGGKTVAEIFNERAQLTGKKVMLRAKVMKISRNILGKNWITLSDSTGTAPTDSIVAVSKESPTVGDIVVCSGNLKADVNLGTGYQYKALIEEAQFSK